MRNYSPMRLPPMADRVLRNELRRTNDWLRQLGPLLGRTVTLPQGTPSAVTQDVDLGNYLYLPGRQGGQISYGRVRFAAKIMPAGSTSVPDTAQTGFGLLSQSSVDGQTSVNVWIEESSPSLPKRPTREWVFPAFNEPEGETAGIHTFVDAQDYQQVTNKTMDQGCRFAFGFNTGTGLIDSSLTRLCHLTLENLSQNRNASTHAMTASPAGVAIPAMDILTGLGISQKDKTHTLAIVRSPISGGNPTSTPFEIGAFMYGGDTQKELYNMPGEAKGGYPGPTQGDLIQWNPTFTITGDVNLSTLITNIAPNTTGIKVGQRVRDVRTNTSWADRWVVSVDSATQITVSSSFSETTPGLTFKIVGPNYVGLSGLDHGGLGGLADDDHLQYLLLAGRTGGQVIGSGAHTGGNSTDVVIEGRLLLGDDLTGVNFTSGRSLDIRGNAFNNGAMMAGTLDLTNLTGTASGTTSLATFSSTGNPLWSAGSATALRCFNAVMAFSMPAAASANTVEAFRSQLTLSSPGGGITNLRGQAIQLNSSGSGNITNFEGISIGMGTAGTTITNVRGLTFDLSGGTPTVTLPSVRGINFTTNFFNDTDVTVWEGIYIPAITNPGTVRGIAINVADNYISGGLTLGATTDPTHLLELGLGSFTSAQIGFTDRAGILLTTPVAGAFEYSQDNLYLTITTGAARKTLVLTDGTILTSGRVPYASTGGRLIDSASVTYNGTTFAVPSLTNAALTSGRVTFAGASGVLTDDADMTFSGDTLTVTKIAATTLTGDVSFSGSGVGLPYGSCWGNEIGWSQAAAAAGTFYEVSDADMADGELNNVTHDGSGKLTVSIAGRYLINYSVSLECDAANLHLVSAISINGTEVNPGRNHFHRHSASAANPLSGTAIINLAVNDTVEVAVGTSDAGTPLLSVEHLNISVVQIGG